MGKSTSCLGFPPKQSQPGRHISTDFHWFHSPLSVISWQRIHRICRDSQRSNESVELSWTINIQTIQVVTSILPNGLRSTLFQWSQKLGPFNSHNFFTARIPVFLGKLIHIFPWQTPKIHIFPAHDISWGGWSGPGWTCSGPSWVLSALSHRSGFSAERPSAVVRFWETVGEMVERW